MNIKIIAETIVDFLHDKSMDAKGNPTHFDNETLIVGTEFHDVEVFDIEGTGVTGFQFANGHIAYIYDQCWQPIVENNSLTFP